jgi:formylmethanofuran dehydrogenase subunit E
MIPDNYDLWARHDRECEEALNRLPVCDKCKKRIQDDFYFYIEGEILCEKCMEDKYMRRTEDYME